MAAGRSGEASERVGAERIRSSSTPEGCEPVGAVAAVERPLGAPPTPPLDGLSPLLARQGLDRDCRALIADRLDRATHPKVISPLQDAVGADPHMGKLLETLTTYAKRGRFYNLDHLAGNPQETESPAKMWDQLIDAAFFSRADLQPLLGQDNESWTRLRRETNQMLVDSLSTWQALYARAWAHGVCGT
jgi:hypothetical protein